VNQAGEGRRVEGEVLGRSCHIRKVLGSDPNAELHFTCSSRWIQHIPHQILITIVIVIYA
jgi:hypothetical protein